MLPGNGNKQARGGLSPESLWSTRVSFFFFYAPWRFAFLPTPNRASSAGDERRGGTLPPALMTGHVPLVILVGPASRADVPL